MYNDLAAVPHSEVHHYVHRKFYTMYTVICSTLRFRTEGASILIFTYARKPNAALAAGPASRPPHLFIKIEMVRISALQPTMPCTSCHLHGSMEVKERIHGIIDTPRFPIGQTSVAIAAKATAMVSRSMQTAEYFAVFRSRACEHIAADADSIIIYIGNPYYPHCWEHG